MDLPGGTGVKNPCLQCGRDGFDPWVGKIPWRRKCQPTLVFLPAKSYGQRSLVGYSPWSHNEQEYCSGLPHPPPGDLPKPGIEPKSFALAGRFFTTEPPGKPVSIFLTTFFLINLTGDNHVAIYKFIKSTHCIP